MPYTIEKTKSVLKFSYKDQPKYKILNVVEFKELKLANVKEDKQGEVLFFMTMWPNYFTIQFRACQSLSDGTKERNLMASCNLSIQELEEMLSFAKQLQ